MDVVATGRALGNPVRLRVGRLLLQNREVLSTMFDDVLLFGKTAIGYHLKAPRSAGLMVTGDPWRPRTYPLPRTAIDHEPPGTRLLLLLFNTPALLPPGSEPPTSISSRGAIQPPSLLSVQPARRLRVAIR